MEYMDNSRFLELYNKIDSNKQEILQIILLSFQPEDRNIWISVPEAAHILGVSPQTVRSMVAKGRIPFCRPSERKTMVERSYVEKLALRA